MFVFVFRLGISQRLALRTIWWATVPCYLLAPWHPNTWNGLSHLHVARCSAANKYMVYPHVSSLFQTNVWLKDFASVCTPFITGFVWHGFPGQCQPWMNKAQTAVWLVRYHLVLDCHSLGRTPLINKPSGWWFGTCFIFPYIGNNHPNWRTHIFQRGWNHQPAMVMNPGLTFPFFFFFQVRHGSRFFRAAGGRLCNPGGEGLGS